MLKIYGHSDDLIEVVGDIREEFAYPHSGAEDGVLIATSAGVLLRIRLGEVWRIEVVAGAEHVSIKPCPEDDEDNYSDVATIAADVAWVACGRAWAKAS
ncbi:hypothetical protein [Amycolatopsis thermoflava]|uniref:hypothetical protein n=1 Tax=Amycolatopsis thermoflava TaxID=84480 RepID=UPI003F4A2DC7